MRKILAAGFGTLVAYSAVMVLLESHGSVRLARVYLEDPAPLIPFAGIHTALSAALLAACGLAFAAARRAESAAGRIDTRTAFFLDSQTVLFVALAFDEQCRILPLVATRLGFAETGGYLALGAAELGLLLGPGHLLSAPRWARAAAFAAAVLFGVALGLDHAPLRWPLRECLEELPKIWGGALFLVVAWGRFEAALDALAFPGVAGAAFTWAQTGRAAVPPARRMPPPRRAPAPRPVPAMDPQGNGPAPGSAAGGAAKRSGAPVRGTGAPEPDPQCGASDSSAAPPRKLLSH